MAKTNLTPRPINTFGFARVLYGGDISVPLPEDTWHGMNRTFCRRLMFIVADQQPFTLGWSWFASANL
jgi:hypothetical protein